MFDFLNWFFRKDEPGSSQSARNRLKLVLIQDRAQVCPELMDSLRTELVQLISRYMVIDEGAMSVELQRREGAVALAASIPVINIRRTQPETEAHGGVLTTAAQAAEARRARFIKRKREALRRRRSSIGDDLGDSLG